MASVMEKEHVDTTDTEDATTESEHEHDKPTAKKTGRKKQPKRCLETYMTALELIEEVGKEYEIDKDTLNNILAHVKALGKSLVKKPKDDSKPKRPPTPWSMFVKAVSEQIKATSGDYYDAINPVMEEMKAESTSGKQGILMSAMARVFKEGASHHHLYKQFVDDNKDFISGEKERYLREMKESGHDVKPRNKSGMHTKYALEELDKTISDPDEKRRYKTLLEDAIKKANASLKHDTPASASASASASATKKKSVSPSPAPKKKKETTIITSDTAPTPHAGAGKSNVKEGVDITPASFTSISTPIKNPVLIEIANGKLLGKNTDIDSLLWLKSDVSHWKPDTPCDLTGIEPKYKIAMVDGKRKPVKI